MITSTCFLLSLTSSMLAFAFPSLGIFEQPQYSVFDAPATVCERPAFSGSRLSTTLTAAFDSAMADFDNDGRLDIALRGGVGSSVWIQRGLGNGYFAEPVVVDATSTNGTVIAADFNNDGRADLFVVNRLYFGLGNGTFSAPRLLTLSPSATSYSSADFNGDDNPDLAAYLLSNGTYEIFYGDGTGGFGPAVPLAFSSTAGPSELTDVNGDGLTDFAVLLNNNTLSIALANPNGTFATPVNYPFGGSVYINALAAGDIDSDGDRDIVGVGAPSSGASSYRTVFRNNGTGAFTLQTTTFENTPFTFRAILGDVDGDNDLDLINNQASRFAVSLGNNDGTFQAAAPAFPGVGSHGKLYLEDFTGDGVPDLAHSNSTVASFSVYPNNGSGGMGAKQFDIEDDFFSTGISIADFNEDNKSDVVWVNDTVNFKVAFGDGLGGIGTINTIASPKVPRTVMTPDFNNDGHKDIVMVAQNNGEFSATMVVFLGNGNGTFQPFFTALGLAPQAAKNPLMVDLSGDGIPDLVTQDLSTRVYIHQSFGNGFFIYRGTIDFATTFGSMTAGDYDQDGKMDLAILSFSAHVYLNKGNWQWDYTGAFPAGSANLDIVTSDFNNDGISDLAYSGVQTGSNPPGKVGVLLGVGKGGFAGPREYIVSFGPGTIEVADFDGDGNQDIAVSNSPYSGTPTDQRVTVMYGDGTGSFPRIAHTAAAINPRYLSIGDFDSDNKPDIAVVDHNLAYLTILINTCLPAPASNFPTLSANADLSVNEGDSTNTNVNLTVTLSAPSTVPVRVRYYTAPQVGAVGLTESELFEASGRSDYRVASGEIKFLPGETSKSIQIIVLPDLLDEYDEKFNVFLKDATNASIADNRTVLTIVDNDASPVVSIGNVSAPEGNTGTTPIALPISLSAVSGKPVTVQFQTGGGTAIPDQDYTRTQGAYTIPAGQLTASIPVNIIGDLTFESNETFLGEISQPVNATTGTSVATATIQNDDIGGSVQFSSATYSTPETLGANITITRTGGNAGAVSVRFRTQAGTAIPGQDYTETVTTVNFADNEMSKNVLVPITSDQLEEFDETVNLVLDQPNGVTVGSPNTAVLTIIGNTTLSNLSISDAAVAEGDSGTSYLQFTLRLSRPVQYQVSVNFATADGTATSGVDYQSASGTAQLVPGMTRRLISVPVSGDFLPETDETVLLNLSGVVNANLTDNQAIGRILNDEIATSSTVRLLSANPAGDGSGNNDSYDPYISGNGNVAVFEGFASNLTGTPDGNGTYDIFARNLLTQTTQLVSMNRFGTAPGNAGGRKPFISSDGRFVAFNSQSNDLTPEGTGSLGSVFLRDLHTNQTRIVSVNTGGMAANGDVMAISATGRFVVFRSAAQDLTSVPDTGTSIDVFVRDTQLNVTTLVSPNSAGNGPGNGDSGLQSALDRIGSITADGRYVMFMSDATNLVTTTHSGGSNVYVRDLQTQTTTGVSVNSSNSMLVGAFLDGATMSNDGRYVYFSSGNGTVVGNDTNNVVDVFRRDLQTSTTQLVSVSMDGTTAANGGSSDVAASADGRYVAFSSLATNLNSLPVISPLQTYWRDMNTGTTQTASINAAGTASSNNQSNRAGLSADGKTAFFTSLANDLVSGVDSNANFDLYLRDFVTNETKLVSVNESGTTAGNNPTVGGTISNDGRVVAFTTAASNLVSIDTNGFGPDAFAFLKTIPPLPISDFDGDGKTDYGVYRPGSSTWYIENSGDGSFRAQGFGVAGDVPVSKDYDGDGKTDIAVFRAGVWYFFSSRDNTTISIPFGQAGDVPVPGDYDGDLKADLGVFRQGVWQIRESSDGNVRTVQFGIPTDVPAVADWDGDRREDVAVFRDGVWYIMQSRDFSVRIDTFGQAGDKPVQGDFDGDQKADLAVFRPSNGAWFILYSSNGTAIGTQFGLATDVPLRADFDGDRKADLSIFRDGAWYIIRSSDGAIVFYQFGIPNDVPTSR